MSAFTQQFTITNRMTADLTRIDPAGGFREVVASSENRVLKMGNRALVLETHHTTHIEGTRLTLEEVVRS